MRSLGFWTGCPGLIADYAEQVTFGGEPFHFLVGFKHHTFGQPRVSFLVEENM